LKTIVLIDKDETLVDVHTEQVTDPGVVKVIRCAQEHGIKVGIHSDSPLYSLAEWHERLGMNGPIVAELGTIVDFRDSSQPFYAVADDLRQSLYGLRYEFIGFAETVSADVWIGDVVENRLMARLGAAHRRIIGVNARRRSSCLVFCWRTTTDGALRPDNELLDRSTTYIHNLSIASQCKVEKNLRHGVLVIHASLASKRLGTECIRARYPATRIIMIGNTMIDYCGEGVTHAAVSNADDNFKQTAEYVSPHNLTVGVSDILERIVSDKL
jgi:hydroxymethylpyrimidine pyrophosphatase-like HAD family hydrolase